MNKEKKKYNSFYIDTRKFQRKRARQKMEKEGIRHINKRLWITLPNGMRERSDSFFAENWKEYGKTPIIKI